MTLAVVSVNADGTEINNDPDLDNFLNKLGNLKS